MLISLHSFPHLKTLLYLPHTNFNLVIKLKIFNLSTISFFSERFLKENLLFNETKTKVAQKLLVEYIELKYEEKSLLTLIYFLFEFTNKIYLF